MRALLAPLGISYSPALMTPLRPSSRTRIRKVSAERIAPCSSSLPAMPRRLAPSGTTIAMSRSSGPVLLQPTTNQPATAASPSAIMARRRQSRRRMKVLDRLHHEAGIGAAEAEAVVEHCLDLPLLGDMRHE